MRAAVIAIVLAGCSAPTGLGAGSACVRSVQCQPGLVCNMGMCTSNLTGFGTGMPSMPQVRDAGPVDGQIDLDAAADAFVPYLDSGPGVDAFVPPVDAYVPALDAFVPDVDAFVPAVDAFVPDVDAFVPGVDAGT